MPLLLSKIKNYLQENELIGKIDSSVPLIILKTLEIFLIDLFSTTVSLTKKLKKKKIRVKYLKYILKKKRRYGEFFKKNNFLNEIHQK